MSVSEGTVLARAHAHQPAKTANRERAPRNKAHLSSLKLYKIIFRCRSCSVLVASFSAFIVVFVILPFSYNCFTAYVHPYPCIHAQSTLNSLAAAA